EHGATEQLRNGEERFDGPVGAARRLTLANPIAKHKRSTKPDAFVFRPPIRHRASLCEPRRTGQSLLCLSRPLFLRFFYRFFAPSAPSAHRFDGIFGVPHRSLISFVNRSTARSTGRLSATAIGVRPAAFSSSSLAP